jgi:hypothetical protein
VLLVVEDDVVDVLVLVLVEELDEVVVVVVGEYWKVAIFIAIVPSAASHVAFIM